jgi:hypothetical protein
VSWQPLTSYRTNDSVQPSTYNGFMYVATFLQPTSPTTSTDTEPVWPTTEYATVIESSSGPTTTSQPPEPPAPPPSQPPGTDPGGRYGNPGGSGIKSSLINPIRPN